MYIITNSYYKIFTDSHSLIFQHNYSILKILNYLGFHQINLSFFRLIAFGLTLTNFVPITDDELILM